VTRRHDLQRRLHALDEIRNIMAAMKNLALLETRKLSRFLAAQQRVLTGIEAAAIDFFDFHPATGLQTQAVTDAYVLVGSERGFCGNFNELVMDYFEAHVQRAGAQMPLVLAVGRKLGARLEHDERVVARIDGANVSEEVPRVLNQLVQTVSSIQAERGALRLSAIYHTGHDDGLRHRQLLPPVALREGGHTAFRQPPLLNLTPAAFVAELVDHYLFAGLHQIFYGSLMAENQRRIQHMERAIDRLDQQAAEASLRYHALRQEEITEEIEVILLSAAGSPDDRIKPRHRKG
jgi:F-type H+-transporting ATPase subunit gamma